MKPRRHVQRAVTNSSSSYTSIVRGFSFFIFFFIFKPHNLDTSLILLTQNTFANRYFISTNFLIAAISAIFIKLLVFLPMEPNIAALLNWLLLNIVRLNLLLGIFNLIPIPPLDGSKVFALLLPEKQAAAYLSIGSIGIFILFFLLMFPIGGFSLGEFIFNLLNFSEKLLGI